MPPGGSTGRSTGAAGGLRRAEPERRRAGRGARAGAAAHRPQSRGGLREGLVRARLCEEPRRNHGEPRDGGSHPAGQPAAGRLRRHRAECQPRPAADRCGGGAERRQELRVGEFRREVSEGCPRGRGQSCRMAIAGSAGSAVREQRGQRLRTGRAVRGRAQGQRGQSRRTGSAVRGRRGGGTALRSRLLGSARVWCAGSAAGRPGAAVQGYGQAREGEREEGRAPRLGGFRSGVPATAAPWRPVGAPPCPGCYITEGAEVAVGAGSIHPLLGAGLRDGCCRCGGVMRRVFKFNLLRPPPPA